MTGSGDDEEHTEASESASSADSTDTGEDPDGSADRESEVPPDRDRPEAPDSHDRRKDDSETSGESGSAGVTPDPEPSSRGEGPPREQPDAEFPRGRPGPSDGRAENESLPAGADGEWRSPDRQSATEGARGPEQNADSEGESWKVIVRDISITVIAVLLVGAYLFAISGVWPPMVAIESGSMEPNMEVNDMVFVMEADRFQPAAAQGDTGVVTRRGGAQAGYEQFGKHGDVIIFEPGGNGDTTPIIHRAMFWVEEGENWCEMGNPEYVGLTNTEGDRCVADHAGFITKGDANPEYDQAGFGQSASPVKPEWVIGTAERRIPGLGWFRLQY